MGVIDGTPFIGLPGNPAASFITQVYVVRPAVLALMGIAPRARDAATVRAGVPLQEKGRSPRICAGKSAAR